MSTTVVIGSVPSSFVRPTEDVRTACEGGTKLYLAYATLASLAKERIPKVRFVIAIPLHLLWYKPMKRISLRAVSVGTFINPLSAILFTGFPRHDFAATRQHTVRRHFPVQ